jgi:predicted RND superfamily exporter protein
MKIFGFLPSREKTVASAARFITRRAAFLLAGTLLLSLFFSFHVFHLQTTSSIDDFFDWTSPSAKFFRDFKKVFPKEEFFIIAFKDKDIFTTANLTLIRSLTNDLKDIEEVMDVTSLANVTDTVGNEDSFVAEDFLKDIPADPPGLEDLGRRATSNPLFLRQLISSDRRTTAIVVYAFDRPDDPHYKDRLLSKTREVLDRYSPSGKQFQLAGYIVTNLALNDYMDRDLMRFVPLTFFFVALTIVWVFHRRRLFVLAMANICLTVASTLGLSAYCGFSLNNITSIVIPLCMSLALSDTVHIFVHLDRRLLTEYPDRRDAMAAALREILFPCFLTSLNTALGFLSFTTNRIAAISQFGWIAAAAMMFEFAFSFGFLVPLLLYSNPDKVYRDAKVSEQHIIGRSLRWANRMVQTRSGIIVAVSLTLLMVAGVLATRVKVETDLLKFFWKTDPIRQQADFVEENLCGLQDLSVSFQSSTPGAFKDPRQLATVEQVQNFIKTLPTVDATTSFVDYLKDMNQSFHAEDPRFYRTPENRNSIEQFLLLYSADDINDYVTGDFRHTRLVARISEHSTARLGDLIKRIDAYVRDLETPLDIRVTGYMAQEVHTSRVMVEDQAKNFFQSVGSIWLVMLLVLKSWGLATLFLIPNLFPIVLNFGLMGAAKVALDTGTVLIAASAFGIIVDDTVHFMMSFREKRLRGVPIPVCVQEVLFQKGEGMLSSLLILTVAFGVLLLSRFVPIFHFGILNVFVLLSGMIGDIFFMTSLLILWNRWRNKGLG